MLSNASKVDGRSWSLESVPSVGGKLYAALEKYCTDMKVRRELAHQKPSRRYASISDTIDAVFADGIEVDVWS